MRTLKFRQARIAKDKFQHWHYWGFIDDNKAHFVAPLPPNTGGDSFQYICKDRNDRDVFVNALVWFHWMGKRTKAKVVDDGLFYHIVSCEGEKRGLPRTFCKSDISHIELETKKE